jgi:hypothetical protein
MKKRLSQAAIRLDALREEAAGVGRTPAMKDDSDTCFSPGATDRIAKRRNHVPTGAWPGTTGQKELRT